MYAINHLIRETLKACKGSPKRSAAFARTLILVRKRFADVEETLVFAQTPYIPELKDHDIVNFLKAEKAHNRNEALKKVREQLKVIERILEELEQ
jgi:hypothetical protein